jgi:hypothetical protein
MAIRTAHVAALSLFVATVGTGGKFGANVTEASIAARAEKVANAAAGVNNVVYCGQSQCDLPPRWWAAGS